MKVLRQFRKSYLNGIKWSNEFILQRVYNMVIIMEILYLISTSYVHANIFAIALVMHIVSIYSIGYKKECWEASDKERIYQILYFIINILIIIGSKIITGTWLTLLTILTANVVAFLSFAIVTISFDILDVCYGIFDFIICAIISIGGNVRENENLSNKTKMLQRFCKEHVYTMYTIALNIIVLIVFLNELDIRNGQKVFVLMVYTLTIPIVNLAEDSGMNFYSFYSCM